MPTYQVTLPDGHTYEVESPTELSDAQVMQQAQAQSGGAPQKDSALSRFFGGAMSTSPLNPMNLVRAIAHPVDTAYNMVADPLSNLRKAAGDVKATITGERGDRLPSAYEALMHLGGSVPFIGPAAINAGQKIGEGVVDPNADVAGGLGEVAGLASGALVPKIAANSPAILRGAAKGMRGAGVVADAPVSLASQALFGLKIPKVGGGIARAAARGTEAVANAIENAQTPAEALKPNRKFRQSVEKPYQMPGDLGPAIERYNPNTGGMETGAPAGPELTPMQKFYRDNPMGEGRMTGQFEPPPGGLDSLAGLSDRGQSPASILSDMEESYNAPKPGNQALQSLRKPNTAMEQAGTWQLVPEGEQIGDLSSNVKDVSETPGIDPTNYDALDYARNRFGTANKSLLTREQLADANGYGQGGPQAAEPTLLAKARTVMADVEGPGTDYGMTPDEIIQYAKNLKPGRFTTSAADRFPTSAADIIDVPPSLESASLRGLKAAPVNPWEADVPDFTYEGEANPWSNEYAPGPTVELPENPLALRPAKPVAPWEADVPDFTFEGEANPWSNEFPPGPTVDATPEGVARSSAMQELMNTPTFRALQGLKRR